MSRLIWFTVVVVVLVAIITVTVQDYHSLQHWFAYKTGSLNTPGTPPNYNYFSGFGSVFPWELGIFASVGLWLAAHYRLNNCHIDGCPWLGKFPAAGGHYKVCRKHHPDSHVRQKNVTFEHVQYAHAMHLLRTGFVKLPHKDDHKDTT